MSEKRREEQLGEYFSHPDSRDRLESESEFEAYLDRNMLAVSIAQAALKIGWKAGWKEAAGEWRIIYVDLPTGQVSWHVPYEMTGNLPEYKGSWDGHNLKEKRARVKAYMEGRY